MSTDHDQIRSVLAAYCQLCDDGRFDELAELFSEAATFTVMGRTHQGRDGIRSFMTVAQPPERRGKHIISEPLIEMEGDEAAVRVDYLFVAPGDGLPAITSVGRYHDRFSRDPEGTWRIAEREIVFLGEAPTGD